jgi:hypothetical protein
MTDIQERRSKFFEDRERAASVHEDRAFEYEKLAIDYTNSVFRLLTYLNGGALIALPAALSLLSLSVSSHKKELAIIAGLFVLGLISVLLAQMFAFFTMARRSEAKQASAAQESWLSAMTHYPEQFDYKETKSKADDAGKKASEKLATSDFVRCVGIGCAWLSAMAFIAGCLYAMSVLI